MKNAYLNWDFEQFITFIMYHAAMADFNLAQEEKELILKRVCIDDFNEICHLHKHNSDYENLQVILYYKDKFLKDKEHQDRVYEAMNKIFNADGEFSMYEKNMMRAFNLLLSF